MTRKQQVVMAIVENAATDCSAAHFALPEEVATVKQLVKRGILKMWETGTRTGGYKDYVATYALGASQNYSTPAAKSPGVWVVRGTEMRTSINVPEALRYIASYDIASQDRTTLGHLRVWFSDAIDQHTEWHDAIAGCGAPDIEDELRAELLTLQRGLVAVHEALS